MRSLVKHKYIQPGGQGLGKALAHVGYLQRARGKDRQRTFFNASEEQIDSKTIEEAIAEETNQSYLIHKLILSPGVHGVDLRAYTREVMTALRQRKGLGLNWFAVEHHNSNNPHVHVILMGSAVNGATIKFFKEDYRALRFTGDTHMLRNGFIETIIDERTRERKLKLRHIRFRDNWDERWQEENQQTLPDKRVKLFKRTDEKERIRTERKPTRVAIKAIQSNWLEEALRKDRSRRERELTKVVTTTGRPTRIRADEDDLLRDRTASR